MKNTLLIVLLLTAFGCSHSMRTLPGVPVTVDFDDGLKLSDISVVELNGRYFVTGMFDVPHSQLHNDKGIAASIISPEGAPVWSKNYCIHYISRRIGPNIFLEDIPKEKIFRVQLPGVPAEGHRINIRPLSDTESCRD